MHGLVVIDGGLYKNQEYIIKTGGIKIQEEYVTMHYN